MNDKMLIEKFTHCFDRQNFYGDDDEESFLMENSTDRSCLELVYASLPTRLPVLYEKLVLSYRWAGRALVGDWLLLANPPGSNLDVYWQKCLAIQRLQIVAGSMVTCSLGLAPPMIRFALIQVCKESAIHLLC